MENVCKGDEVVETATRLLLDSLPASLKARLREAVAAGATKEAIIERVLCQTKGQRTLIVLAIEEFLASMATAQGAQ